MINLRLLALFPLMAVGGCSTLPGEDHVGKPPAGSPPEQAAPAEPESRLPDNELSAPLLYGLLVGEVAAQRGEFDVASASYLRAAWDTRDPRLAKRAVRLALAARNQDDALEGAQLWVDLEPANGEGRQILAALLIRAGRADDAAPHLEALLETPAADTSQGYDAIVSLLSRETDKALALSIFERVAKKHPGDPNAQFGHAQLAFMLGRQEEAARELDALLKQRPNWTKALVLKSTLLRHQGKTEAAVESFKAAVSATPGDAGLRLSYARLLVDVQHYEEARREFESLQRQLPDNSDITYALGLLTLQLGDTEAAEKQFRRLLQIGQRTDESAYALGQIAESREQWDEALRWYAAVEEGTNAMDARLRSAAIIMRRSGLDEARNYLHLLQAEAPVELQPRFTLAEAELIRNAGKFPEALALLDTALKASPSHVDLLYARAMVAERLDRIDLMERDLRQILKTDPENAQALNALGYTLADRTSRHKEALELIRRALAKHPDDPAINDSMGWVLFRLGRHAEAEGYLKKAYEALKDAEVAAHLGELYWVMGRKDDAHRVWNDGLQQAPDDPLIKTVIKRLTQ